jgi:SAM-dependent methyltransferase
MKKIIKKFIRLVLTPFVLPDYIRFKALDKQSRFPIDLRDFHPQIKDKTVTTNFDRHYVYHTAWAVRKVAAINPAYHVDISSLLHFSGMLSAFVPVRFYDYRPADINLSNLTSEHADLLKLPFADNSIVSLSCMHTVEHVGLGRYGDPIDPDGDLKAIKELIRVLQPGGNLLFVVPVGRPHIEYNAHRVYSYAQVIEYFSDLELREYYLIPEASGAPIINATAEQTAKENYACGCFWLVKK